MKYRTSITNFSTIFPIGKKYFWPERIEPITRQETDRTKNKPLRICSHSEDMVIMNANLWRYSPENKSAKDRMFLFIILNSFSNNLFIIPGLSIWLKEIQRFLNYE